MRFENPLNFFKTTEGNNQGEKDKQEGRAKRMKKFGAAFALFAALSAGGIHENEAKADVRDSSNAMFDEMDATLKNTPPTPTKISEDIPGIKYDRDQFIKEMERVDSSPEDIKKIDESKKRIIFERAINEMKEMLATPKDYRNINNPALRRSRENRERLQAVAFRAFLDNPEKATTRMIDENRIIISIQYEHPDSGFPQIYDYIYTFKPGK